MARTYEPIKLTTEYPADTVYGQCDQCGDGATHEDVRGNPNLYTVEIVGTIKDAWSENGFICRDCYDRSKERSFVIYMRDGEDVMTSFDTLEEAMRDILDYLQNPLDYGRYAPFRIVAQRGLIDVEHIATIDMPEADKRASLRKHYPEIGG